MNLQGAPSFSPEDYPDAPEALLQRLTEAFDDLYAALARVPESAITGGSFKSATSGVSTLELKNPLPAKPQHVTLSLRRDDFADFSAAWSWWWKVSGDQVRFSFIGLPASVRLVYTVEFL
jgi:hypothetical protein